MRIEGQGHSIEKITSSKVIETKDFNSKSDEELKLANDDERKVSSEEMQLAVDSVNEFFEINHSELKFVFHEGLEKYFVQLIDTNTEEVVREIPPKKLLDAFYEMQKLAGMIVDERI